MIWPSYFFHSIYQKFFKTKISIVQKLLNNLTEEVNIINKMQITLVRFKIHQLLHRHLNDFPALSIHTKTFLT